MTQQAMDVAGLSAREILQWYLDAGVDEAISDEPVNYFALAAPKPAPTPEPPILQQQAEAPAASPPSPASGPAAPLHHSPSAAMAQARTQADEARDLAQLEAAVRAFDGCALKRTASKTVFADGYAASGLMIIGEAPGAQEDQQGIPFCGPSGALLDKMLAAIGRNRADGAYISNTVFWRPPGNRQPSSEEAAICLPFVEKHIALVRPKLLVLAGGVATTSLLRKDTSIGRLRGKLYDYKNDYMDAPVKALVTFHPSYLLRTPAQKRLAWHDLLLAKNFLDENS